MVFTCLSYSSRNGSRTIFAQSPRAGGPVSLRRRGCPSRRLVPLLRRVRAAAACERSECYVAAMACGSTPSTRHVELKATPATHHLEGRHALLLAPLLDGLPRAPRARRVRRQPGVDVAAACVEINPCVGCGRRDDSARTRRKILIATQAATPVEHVALVEELVLVLGAFRARPSHRFHAAVAPPDRRYLSNFTSRRRR